MNQTQALQAKPFDPDEWQKLYYRHQQQYIRQRLEYLYVPSYSPKLNLVEYIIHLLRLRFLHHFPVGTILSQTEQQLEQFLASHQFLSAQQGQKTLNFIFSLVA